MDEEKAQPAAAPQTAEQMTQTPEPESAPQTPQVEGRRTQLRVVREGVESLTTDVWKLTRAQEASVKRLEKQVAALRKDLAAHARSKEISDQLKAHHSTTKNLEKHVASLSKDVAALRSSIAKETARTKSRDEAALSRILSKVTPKTKTKKKSTKRSKKR